MPEYLAPGVYVEEIATGPVPIEGVSTSTAGLVGQTVRGLTELRLVTSWLDFQRCSGLAGRAALRCSSWPPGPPGAVPPYGTTRLPETEPDKPPCPHGGLPTAPRGHWDVGVVRPSRRNTALGRPRWDSSCPDQVRRPAATPRQTGQQALATGCGGHSRRSTA